MPTGSCHTVPGRKTQANKRAWHFQTGQHRAGRWAGAAPGAGWKGLAQEEGGGKMQSWNPVPGGRRGMSSGTDVAGPGSHNWWQQEAAEVVSIRFCVQVNQVFQFSSYNRDSDLLSACWIWCFWSILSCQYKHLNFLGTGHLIPKTFSPGPGLILGSEMLHALKGWLQGLCLCSPWLLSRLLRPGALLPLPAAPLPFHGIILWPRAGAVKGLFVALWQMFPRDLWQQGPSPFAEDEMKVLSLSNTHHALTKQAADAGKQNVMSLH